MINNTIFLGNSFNRCANNEKSWDNILNQINVKNNIDLNDNLMNSSMYTFIYESLLSLIKYNDNDFNRKEEEIKTYIAKELTNMKISDLYYNLIAIPNITNIITTNYDNCIEQALLKKLYVKQNFQTKEDIYSIRRKEKFISNTDQKTIWNIHGEVNYPKSIMLGYDHYCSYIAKIDSYIKGNYTFQIDKNQIKIKSIEDKIKNNSYDNHSWIELFFNSNVHILGFGLDYSELDIWWLLIRRARLIKKLKNKLNNKIYFYGSLDDIKIKFLESYGVIYKEIPVHDDNYPQQNLDIMNKLNL